MNMDSTKIDYVLTLVICVLVHHSTKANRKYDLHIQCKFRHAHF